MKPVSFYFYFVRWRGNSCSVFVVAANEQFIYSEFLKQANGDSREIFVSNFNFDPFLFKEEEIKTLANITKIFADMPTWDIVALSHQEKHGSHLSRKKINRITGLCLGVGSIISISPFVKRLILLPLPF